MRLQVNSVHIFHSSYIQFKRRNKWPSQWMCCCVYAVYFFASSLALLLEFVLKVLQNAMSLWILLIHVR